MSNYFERKDIEKLIIAHPEFQEQIGWNRAIHAVLSLQAADVRPAKYGSWVRGRCSNCHHMDVEEPDYCSRCGSCNSETVTSNQEQDMDFKVMDDCIHLKACRRIQKIAKKNKGWSVPRYCTNDCSAYVSGKNGNYVTINEAVEYARDGVDSIRSGYGSYDVYAPCDLFGKTLGEIVQAYNENK